MSMYKKLDEALIKNISAGKKSLIQISQGDVLNEAQLIAILTGYEYFRVIDRRLQALRKADKICFTSKTGWLIVFGATA